MNNMFKLFGLNKRTTKNEIHLKIVVLNSLINDIIIGVNGLKLRKLIVFVTDGRTRKKRKVGVNDPVVLGQYHEIRTPR